MFKKITNYLFSCTKDFAIKYIKYTFVCSLLHDNMFHDSMYDLVY